MAKAVAIAKAVKKSPSRAVLEIAEQYLVIRVESAPAPAHCCPPADTAPVALGKTVTSPKKRY
ncbi:hypothetical protein [Anaeromyxobacter sp. PSR-1]|uniref:hypothetical protein n=1 Tax=Anaeromyxobacter sp. PSR-1 TaxID=1300915 RepID=UPI00126A6B55|nr:hypothetical protein [Anaeromyxobacter sp. PSR-1]